MQLKRDRDIHRDRENKGKRLYDELNMGYQLPP